MTLHSTDDISLHSQPVFDPVEIERAFGHHDFEPIARDTGRLVRSAPRKALVEHHKKMAGLRAKCEEARRPFLESTDKLSGARADLRHAEDEYEAAAIAQVESVMANGPGAAADHVETIVKAQQRVDLTRRIIKALESKRGELECAVAGAEATFAIANSATEKLIGDVLAEVIDTDLDLLKRAETPDRCARRP